MTHAVDLRLTPGSVAAEIVGRVDMSGTQELDIEHPTGFFTVTMDVGADRDKVVVHRAALLRTARLLMRGEVFIPERTVR